MDLLTKQVGVFEDIKTLCANYKKDGASRKTVDYLEKPHHLYADDTEILLTTVQVKVKTADGTFITLRGLLDQGSQINLITENAAQLLRLSRTKFDGT
ncbi:hypothetical protein SFRURICE_009846, partial [Spodoptera frugiperda]